MAEACCQKHAVIDHVKLPPILVRHRRALGVAIVGTVWSREVLLQQFSLGQFCLQLCSCSRPTGDTGESVALCAVSLFSCGFMTNDDDLWWKHPRSIARVLRGLPADHTMPEPCQHEHGHKQ